MKLFYVLLIFLINYDAITVPNFYFFTFFLVFKSFKQDNCLITKHIKRNIFFEEKWN